MGTAQSSKRATANADEVGLGGPAHHAHLASVKDGGISRGEDSPVDFEARRRVTSLQAAAHGESPHSISAGDVPDSVNQMLQATLGDEPGLNMTTMHHDNNATEHRQPGIGEPKNERSKLPTVFRWEHGGDEVYLAGTFSHWKRIPMVRSRDNFFTIYELAEGEHEFKFVVDGAWKCDEKAETKSAEPGTLNNVIRVKKSDFEVFEALQNDVQTSASTTASHKEKDKDKDKDRRSGESEQPASTAPRLPFSQTVPGTYSQEMPSRRSLEFEPPPPALPPHLLQVLLNKDTAANYDPNLLPEPNHVMLNHLYALSIREGVMVLSATHRYRKKYVTTLLYKPIQ